MVFVAFASRTNETEASGANVETGSRRRTFISAEEDV